MERKEGTKMKQTEKVKKFIEENGSITARQALDLGIMRLASRISEIRMELIGTDRFVKTENVKVQNRDGSTSWIARYSIQKRGGDIDGRETA